MAHFVSQPLMRPLAAPLYTATSAARTTYAVPDAYDSRYPRRWWVRALRMVASAWWMPLVIYLAQGATLLLLAEQAARFATAPDGTMVAKALHVAWIPAFILEQPAGLVIIVLSLVALLLTLVVGITAGRWANADRRGEAQVMMFRLARPEERLNPSFVRKALAPALAFRLSTARARRRLMTVALVVVSLVAGVLLALNLPSIG